MIRRHRVLTSSTARSTRTLVLHVWYLPVLSMSCRPTFLVEERGERAARSSQHQEPDVSEGSHNIKTPALEKAQLSIFHPPGPQPDDPSEPLGTLSCCSDCSSVNTPHATAQPSHPLS